ncbi:MAG: hypothetical protein U9P90_03105 [Patescibacteria group bacterium]|nr:hypothetical protein [Patescibacteria group bacterium]
MSKYKRLTNEEIEKTYKMIKKFHNKFLKKHGVKLPKLKQKNKFTKDALVMVYLVQDYPNTRRVSKTELTQFVREYYPDTPDVQQGRHLGAQGGWWIIAGGRDNIVEDLPRGTYKLHDLEKPYPSFKRGHRITQTGNWEKLKAQYGSRCATCGSEDGQLHLHWPATKTKLQKAHMNPCKPLRAGNIIPQCQKCNRGDRNRWIYDEKGRVIKLSDPSVIKNCSKEVRQKVYRILHKEFKGKNPHAKK